jgi:hypothetical protein
MVPVLARTLCTASILILLAAPVEAALPLAFFAKQIIQSVVKDFVKSEFNSMVRQALGPCKSMLADMGVGTVGTIQSLVSGGASIPSMLAGGMPSMPGSAGMPGGMPAGMDEAMRARMMQTMPQMPAGMLDMPGMDPAMRAQVMQMMSGGMPGMGSPAPEPLSTEEVDELVTRLAAFSKAMPDNPLPCSPEDLKLVFNMSATSMPMMSGSFRMMLTAFRGMDERFKEVEETFAKMSSAEQAEAVDLMVADAQSMSAADRKQLASFLQSDVIPLPAAVREQLRIRLGGQ